MTQKLVFDDKAKPIQIDGHPHVGVWTDGVGVTSDNGKSPWISGPAPCAMKLEPGKRYRVTIEELLD